MSQADLAYEYDPELICPEPLLSILGGDWSAYGEILQVFLGDLARMTEQVQRCASASDRREDLVFALHDLAGALGASGSVEALQEVNALVQEVRQGRDGRWREQLPPALQRVQQFAAVARKVLAHIERRLPVRRLVAVRPLLPA